MTALTLADFLRARLDEDEAVAREATPGPWRVDNPGFPEAIVDPAGEAIVSGSRWGGEAPVFASGEDAKHIARHDPARVLADVEAKRRIVDLHPNMLGWCQGCASEAYPCRTLTLLALPYADHPDYRQEWKP